MLCRGKKHGALKVNQPRRLAPKKGKDLTPKQLLPVRPVQYRAKKGIFQDGEIHQELLSNKQGLAILPLTKTCLNNACFNGLPSSPWEHRICKPLGAQSGDILSY